MRQFDLRLPSSAYPQPRGGRGILAHRASHDNSNVPPPLISYKRFNLDLNTISCSASQPHYIALGGAHLHCFLHDRRMLGRNIDKEQGKPCRSSPASSMSSRENELMGQATQCVRKFAPEGRKRMRRTDNGHITACKISDANPNEMIASWSGDHIYSFDLLRSPDASEKHPRISSASIKAREYGKVKESGDRKRKWKKAPSVTSLEGGSGSSKPRRVRQGTDEVGDLTLRVRYDNGQSEDIAMGEHLSGASPAVIEHARNSMLSETQKRSMQIAKSIVEIRKMLFSLEASSRARGSQNPSDHVASFTSALGLAATHLQDIDEVSRSWRYPVNPTDHDVRLQRTLRSNRDSSRRFVQSAGTLAKILGGKIQTASRIESPASDAFRDVRAGPQESPIVDKREVFCYDFLKAIISWLQGGPQALLQNFKQPPDQRKDDVRFPIPDDAQLSGIDDYLIPQLLRSASEASIFDIDTSRFERDETRIIFSTETSAVIAFGNAIKMPLEDLSKAVVPAPNDDEDRPSKPPLQDKKTAAKYWGFRVGRSLLMKAGEEINFQFVDMAFGGLGTLKADEGQLQQRINPDEEEDAIQQVSQVREDTGSGRATPQDTVKVSTQLEASRTNDRSPSTVQQEESDIDIEDAGSDAEVILMDDLHDEIADHLAAEEDQEDNDNDEDYDSDAGDDGDGDITAEERQFMFQSASDRGKLREKVEADVPCFSHTRKYTGHCNVQTVKDANFFGLQDEYVVSGSDDGHFFIWDKKTSELVNILAGDNEVVNVIQGTIIFLTTMSL